jgi:serine-protein kinase ATM
LKRLLDQTQRKQKLSDKNWHEVLKEIFEIIRTEKSNHQKSSRNTDDKFLVCVDAFRLVVEHGVTAFRRKHSSPAIVNHILQTLPHSDGQFYELLTRPYAKILRTFLEYRPHSDHLSEEQWRELVALCLNGIVAKNEELDSDNGTEQAPSTHRNARGSRSATPATGNVSFRPIAARPRLASNVTGDQAIEDFSAALSILLSIPHLPILTVSEMCIGGLLQFFDDASPVSQAQAQEYILSSLNAFLRLSVTENLELGFQLVTRVVPNLRRLWSNKLHTALKDQVLLFLLLGKPLYAQIVLKIESFEAELSRLFNVFFLEYCRRREVDILHGDDLEFRISSSSRPMSCETFHLRTGVSKSEQAWTQLDVLADIFSLVHKDFSTQNDKRRKLENPVFGILDDLLTADKSEKVAYLQFLSFIVLKFKLNDSEQESFVQKLSSIISDDDPQVAYWALVSASR